MSATDLADDVVERRRALVDQRDHLLASLRDLDAELAAGDISPEDHRGLRDQYTARAAAVLRALDEIDAARSAGAPPRARPAARARTRSGGRGRALRMAAVVLIVAGVAGGAGLAMARTAGERLPGQEASGDIVRSSEDRITQAQSLASDGRILDAIKVYDEVLKTDPDNPVALAQRGWLVSRAGLADEGLQTIDRAIAIDPSYPDAWFFKAMIHWRLKDQPDEARTAFERLLALNPPAALAEFVRTQALPQLDGGTPPSTTTAPTTSTP